VSDPSLFFVRRGRPPRAGQRASERIEIVVTADERKAIARVAKDNRQTIAAVVREAINVFAADYGDRVVFTASGDNFKKR